MVPAALLALGGSFFIPIPEVSPLDDVISALGKGRIAQATKIAEGYQAECEKSSDKDPYGTVYALSMFFNIELSRCRVDEADAIARRALRIARARGGEDNAATGIAYELVATIEAKRENEAAAKEAALKCLAIMDKAEGKDADRRANALNLLAWISLSDDPRAAEQYAKEAVSLGERAVGPDAPSLSYGLILLAIACANQGGVRGAEAEEFAIRAINLAEAGWGPNDRRLLEHYRMAAFVKCKRGKLLEGESFLQRAAMLANSMGEEHRISLARIYHELSKIHASQQCLCDAEQEGLEALRLYDLCLGTEGPELVQILDNLAQILNAQQKPEEAYPLLKRANAIRAKALARRGPS